MSTFTALFDPDFWLAAGYLGLFVISFVAATLAPIGSEVFVTAMLLGGYNSWAVLFVATLGNSLGSLANYFVGKWGGDFVLSRWVHIAPTTLQRAHQVYKRWGAPALFFAWAPIIGDALTLVSGTLHLPILTFSGWVILGKLVRYLAVIGLVHWWS